MSGPFGDQCFWQRAFCVRKDRIGRAFLVGALLFGIVPLSMGMLGFIGAGTGYVAIDTGIINFELISTLFPAWAVIPFLFMIVSGLLSTIDSNLCAISSLTTDIFKKKTLRKTKFAMILLLVVGIAIANIPRLTVAIYKTIGSLLTVILSGTVAFAESRKRDERNG